MRSTRPSSLGRRIFIALALICPLLVLGISLTVAFFPQREGPLAMAEVFAPYLFLPLILVLPFGFMRGAFVLRLALLACAVVYIVRFLPVVSFSTPQPDPKAVQIEVMSWNLYKDQVPHDVIRDILSTKPADLVAFQEAEAEWMAHDETIGKVYPYRMRYHVGAVRGLAMLSAYPIYEYSAVDNRNITPNGPPLTWARLDLGKGRTLVAVTAHPAQPQPSDASKTGCWLSICYSTARRDQQIAQIRATIDPVLGDVETPVTPPPDSQLLWPGEPLIMVGDFNLTEREPAYQELSAGLTDAFRMVGKGFGNTWRPAQALLHQDFALLRIDYMFSSPNVKPLAMWVDCTPRGSDHCITHGRFEIK